MGSAQSALARFVGTGNVQDLVEAIRRLDSQTGQGSQGVQGVAGAAGPGGGGGGV